MAHRWASLRGRRLVAAGSQADRLPGVARRRVHGGHRPDQDWSAWTWEAREFGTGTREPRTIRFTCVQRALPEVKRMTRLNLLTKLAPVQHELVLVRVNHH